MLVRLVLKTPQILALLPFWLVIFLASFLNEIWFWVTWPVRRLFFRKPAVDTLPRKEASIAILNWDGADLLAECLPSVVEAVRCDGGNHEIVVIDNGSTDGSLALLREHFPQVRVVALPKNYGFVEGYNRGIQSIQKDILVLLNNDMLVKPDFLRPLLDGFTEADVFGVSAQIFFWDTTRRREESGLSRATWYQGMAAFHHDIPSAVEEKHAYLPAFWLGGGSAAVDRRKFLALGGFDTLMAPFYMEDVDVSYQAWKRGWRVLFCPASQVIHKHRASSGRLGRQIVERITARNRLLFLWKNITAGNMFFSHLLQIPLIPARLSWELSPAETWRVFALALPRLPLALARRNAARMHARVTDAEIFRIANHRYAYQERYLPRPAVDPNRLKILMVCAYFPSPRSGGSVLMYQTIRALARQHAVSLLAFWDEEDDRAYFDDLRALCKEMVAIERVPTQPGWGIPVLPPAIAIDFGDPRFRAALETLLAETTYDVVQVEGLQVTPQLPPLQQSAAVLVHLEVQNAAIQTLLSRETHPRARAHLALRWARWLNAEISLARRYDRVIALTPEDGWNLARFDPRLPVEVIQTGIDLEYFHPQETAQQPNSLIYVGNFRHLPNVVSATFLVNEVLPLVRQEIPDVTLTLVGANPPEAVRALAQPGQVTVTGWVDDMRPYIWAANVYAFPILTGVGLRNKVLEAFAMGKPIVTTRLGAAGLQARHGENVWLAENAQEFSEAICTLLRDPLRRAQIGRGARETVEENNAWSVVAEKYIQVYRRALHERGIS